jgi:hypothetical protein
MGTAQDEGIRIARKRPGRGGRGWGRVLFEGQGLEGMGTAQGEGIRIAVKRERGVVLILIGGIVPDDWG